MTPVHFAHIFSLPQGRESRGYFLALRLPVCLASVQISANGLRKRQAGSEQADPVVSPLCACPRWDTAQTPTLSCLLRHPAARGWGVEPPHRSPEGSNPK